MESAPLNLAHFHERRADKYLKRNRYDEAIKAMETALAYIEDAYKIISIPKAIEVLDAEKWNCSRKLKQINIRQSQYDVPKGSFTVQQPNELQNTDNKQSDLVLDSDISIYKAIENFDAKYTSSTLESLYEKKPDNEATTDKNKIDEDSKTWMEELECKDFPCLEPLELPAFDLGFDAS